MNKGKLAVLSLCIGVVLPAVLIGVLVPPNPVNSPVPGETAPSECGKEGIRIPVMLPSGTRQMELEEYITGVVMAEMPASFEPEALKAQAVVARTYAMRRYELSRKHEGGGICTDPACCQGYVSPEAFGAGEGEEKIRNAVSGTAGLVLRYDGELIDATYFSCSGGTTEDAVAVWGSDVPYLQSTDSPGEEYASAFASVRYLDAETFCAALGIPAEHYRDIGLTTYTSGGGVDTMEIGGRPFSGTELRRLLSLPSTMMEITPSEDGVMIYTKGYGHRVGMSQYGADAMARSGADFREILTHYYAGVTVEPYSAGIDKTGGMG